jgi:hypothetical protein
MSASLSENVILNNIKILALINILEPVTKTTVIKSLGNNINSKQIGLILSEQHIRAVLLAFLEKRINYEIFNA